MASEAKGVALVAPVVAFGLAIPAFPEAYRLGPKGGAQALRILQ